MAGRGLANVAGAMGAGVRAGAAVTATAADGLADAFKQAARGAHRRVERVAGGLRRGAGGGREERQADGLAVGVGAVVLFDGGAGVGQVGVGDEGDALAAVLAVVEERDGADGADAGEEFLGWLDGR